MEYTKLQQDILDTVSAKGYISPMDEGWHPPASWGKRLGILRRCQELVRSGDLVRAGGSFMKNARKKAVTKEDIEAIWAQPMKYV